jgi:hypothetical protein
MAICTNCGKKFNKFTTSVGAKGVCQECFQAELEAEAADPKPADRIVSGEAPAATSQAAATARSNPMTVADAAAKRYSTGYFVARGITGVGAAIKVIGVVLGLLIAIIAFIVGSQTSFIFGLVGLVVALAVAVPVYVLGILVSAQGQLMKAVIDSAIHTSPFLDPHQKASAMSLK